MTLHAPVFLSYRREDASADTQLIAHFLRNSLGAVHDIKEIVAADHCTIFGKQCIDGQDFLMVAVTTAEDVFAHVHSEMFYRVRANGSDQHDGYTGFVGTARQRFHTSNLSDMPQEEKDGWSARGVTWKRGMSEVGEAQIAAFYATQSALQTTN